MILDFRRGSSAEPRGHALVYFETPDGRVFATYLVVAPITIDLAKYMPPMFAGQLPSLEAQQASAMPLPPVPEEIGGGLRELERLAELRNDDLIGAGTIDPRQIERLLMATSEAGQSYASLYKDWLARAPTAQTALDDAPSLAVDEVLMSLMSEHDRIAELAKLIGKVRYGVEVGEPELVSDATGEMERIGRHLPEKYRVGELVAAARRSDELGARLAQLHVERCYKLCSEEYAEVARIEGEIKKLQAG